MPASIGQKLKAARESRRLTLDQAADSTRIRAVYLQALENDDYSVMISAAQGRGFLRLYADFLGLNVDELTAAARDSKPVASASLEADSTPPAGSTPEATPVPETKPSRPGFWSRLLRREPAAQEESKPAEEPLPVPAEEPLAVSLPVEEGKPVTPAKKPARKKAATTEQKTKTAPRKSAAGKKKRTLNRPSKR